MGRLVDLDDLASAGVVTARLGLRRIQALHTWAKRDPTFPAPILYLSRAAIWFWPEVRDWALDRGWHLIAQRPSARRLLVQPQDLVPAELVKERLGFDPDGVLDANAERLYVWADAEGRWNRPT